MNQMEKFNKFEYMEEYGYEQLCLFHDKSTGLKALTCVHNSVLGPGLGGTRVWNYATEDEAMLDVLRLARGMTYKNSIAGLPLGGGKSVVIGDARELAKDSVRFESFWRAFGRFVEGLGGRYITAADVGTNETVMTHIKKETDNVVGLPGGCGSPSPYTARGVFNSLKACCKHVYGSDNVEGKTIAVQGVGAVGYFLCEHLHKAGAKLIVTDVYQPNVDKAVADFGAKAVAPEDIYGVECDIYSPNALGATINDETIPQLKCKIVCGGANNQLKDPAVHGKKLQEKGIVYAPDYVANGGGVINVSFEVRPGGWSHDKAIVEVDAIYGRMVEILEMSDKTGQLSYLCADKMAEARIQAVAKIKGIYLP